MRAAGWERRLDAVIEGARARPYVLGDNDCFRLACEVVKALTGVDRWPQFRGYTTKREALARIAQYGRSFEAAGDWFFRSSRVPMTQARRGDVAALATSDGMKHLGIVMGDRVAFMSAEGLIWIRPSDCLCAWRIG